MNLTGEVQTLLVPLNKKSKKNSYWELLEKFGAEYFGPNSDLDLARDFLEGIEDEYSLKKLKADLRRLHSSSKLRGRK
jgi:hypothetical protein